MELEKITITKNSLGFYDVTVNDETVLEMLAKDEIAESVNWLMNDGMAEIEEIFAECALV